MADSNEAPLFGVTGKDEPNLGAAVAYVESNDEDKDFQGRAETGDDSCALPALTTVNVGESGIIDDTPQSWRPDNTFAYSQTEQDSKATGLFGFDCSCGRQQRRGEEHKQEPSQTRERRGEQRPESIRIVI
jgi:hypothetical protein